MAWGIHRAAPCLLARGSCVGRRKGEVQAQVEGAWQLEGESLGAEVAGGGVDGHAGMFYQQVLQGAGLQQDGLAAPPSEAGWGRDEPALLQGARLYVQEAPFPCLGSSVGVGVGGGVEGGAEDGGAGDGRGNHHKVLLVIVFLVGDAGGVLTTGVRAGLGCGTEGRGEGLG